MNSPIQFIKYFFAGALLLLFSESYTQDQEESYLDSIEIELKYDTLYALYKKKQYDKAVVYGKVVLKEIETTKTSNLKRFLKILRRLGDAEKNNYNFENAKKYYDQGMELAIEHFGRSSSQYANSEDDLGFYYSKFSDFEMAHKHFKKASKVVAELYGEYSYKAGLSYLRLAKPLIKLGNYIEAEHLYHKTLQCYSLEKPKVNRLEELYLNLTKLNITMSRYERAIEFGQTALAINLKRKKPSFNAEMNIRRYLAKALKNKEPQKALKMYQEILEAYEKKTNGIDSNRKKVFIANIYSHIGSAYYTLKDYQKALTYYQKVAVLRKAFKYRSRFYDMQADLDIGRAMQKLKSKRESLDYFNKIWQEFGDESKIAARAKARLLNFISYQYHDLGQIDTALQINTKAIQLIDPSYDPNNFDLAFYKIKNTNPTLQRSFENRSRFLRKKYFEGDKDPKIIELSLVYNEATIELMEKFLKNDFTNFELENIENRKAHIYNNAVFKAHKIYELNQDEKYLEKAFNYAERNKAFLLKQGIANNIALSAKGIPKNILDSLHNLESSIDSMQIAFEDPSKKEKLKEKFRAEIFAKKRQYENLIDELEVYNSEYYNLKYKTFSLDLQKIKDKTISDNALVIEYFYNTNELFIFTIKDAQLKVTKQPLSINLDSSILQLRNKDLGNIVLNRDNTKSYIAEINKLYNLLISPIEEQLDSTKKLVIVPHGILQNLPFEMLTKDNASQDYRKLDYLIKTYNIQYAYSAELWAKDSKTKRSSELAYVGFAPMFEKIDIDESNKNLYAAYRSEFGSLLHSKKEIEEANNIFNGEIFIGTEASESKFLEHAPKSSIIHIASHAIANDKNPNQSVILFSDEDDEGKDALLNLSEIYNLDLTADLAVMSACNTGVGKVKQGEGVMSLGRAFLFAGCKSVMMNLWLANDESSSQIMQSFYKYTSQKMYKDEALRKAKLDYLANADALTAHPYFWANMVAVGDMSPLQVKSPSWRLWLALAVGTFALLGLYYRRRKFSSLPIGKQV